MNHWNGPRWPLTLQPAPEKIVVEFKPYTSPFVKAVLVAGLGAIVYGLGKVGVWWAALAVLGNLVVLLGRTMGGECF